MQESKAAAEQKSSSKVEVNEAIESMKRAAKQSAAVKQEHTKAAAADSDSDVEILEEDAPEKGSLSGFYRAVRETGRANVLLALQVTLQSACFLHWPPQIAEYVQISISLGCFTEALYDLRFSCGSGAKHQSSALPADPTRNRALGQDD